MILQPPTTIGIIGGGQLGMLITRAAKKLGYQVAILDPTSSCPAGQFADKHIVASFSDSEAFGKLAETCDVLTYEFEHIDTDILAALEGKGCRLYPSAKCLLNIKDKYNQKQILKDAGIPVPAFIPVDTTGPSEGIARLGLPGVFKYRRGGYDGKGNIVVHTEDEFRRTWDAVLHQNAMVEQYIPFERELSIIAAKDLNGKVAFYPIAENYHEKGILRVTRAPAQVSDTVRMKVLGIAKTVLSVFEDPGLFCIEMFLDNYQNILVNEIAPRPHNSGHHTLDACRTSQYEQLVRVLTGKPLGDTDQFSPCAMLNILGDETVHGEYFVEGLEEFQRYQNAHLYWYGKVITKHLRKLGHLTVLGESIEAAEFTAHEIHKKIKLKPKLV